MKLKNIILPALLAGGFLPAFAQYDQDINVEGKYVPEYIQHDRIGLFPKPVKFPVEKSSLPYSLGGVNANFTPQAVPIQATAWNADRLRRNSRGYLELGIGSWLESTLSAGYRAVDTPQSTFGVRFQHNSTSLWKPEMSEQTKDTRMWRYDESLGIYGNHSFGSAGRLDAALDYHLGCFDYYGYNPKYRDPEKTYDAPTQTLNDVSARVDWHSAPAPDDISWHAGAGVRYFGYRQFYVPGNYFASGLETYKGDRETHVGLNGGINFPTSTKSAIGLELDGDYLSYDSDRAYYKEFKPDSYGMVALTPYYRFTRDRFDFLLGAKIDLCFNAGPKNDRYGRFHIAPNVRIGLDAGPVALYLNALGGSSLHTLAGNYDLDYYQSPALLSTTPVYTPIDMKFGANFGPYSGFHAGADIAFRASRGQYAAGWYQAMMNNTWRIGFAMLPPVINDGSANRLMRYDLNGDETYNIAGVSFGMNLGYDAGNIFKISAEARYQNQNGKTGYFNGYDRPQWTAGVMAESNPWSTLKLRLGYDLRAMRMMPAAAGYADTTPLNDGFLVSERLPNLSMLNFGASYGLTDNVNLWLQADNLLCRRNVRLPDLEEPRLRLLIGASINF